MRLACWIVSSDGFVHAKRVVDNLALDPWVHGETAYTRCDLYAPSRLANGCPSLSIRACKSLSRVFAEQFTRYAGHICISALGITVRLVAPLLKHKKSDPAVVTIDSQGRFAISVVSGHLGGANALATYLATHLTLLPVITTASDAKQIPSLDLILRKRHIQPLDWDELAPLQGMLLEGHALALYDPQRMLPDSPHFSRIVRFSKDADGNGQPLLCIDWREHAKRKGLLRSLIPCVLGIGTKKGVQASIIREAFTLFCSETHLNRLALIAIATVDAKCHEPGMRAFADELKLPLEGYAASTLATYCSAHPSELAGKIFGTLPFSVCETACVHHCEVHRTLFPKGSAKVLVAKQAYFHAVTMALAAVVQGGEGSHTPDL